MSVPDGVDILRNGRIIISGHQTEVGNALRSHAQEQMERLSAKYFNGAEDVTATFSPGKKGVGFACNVRVHVSRNLFFDGQGVHPRDAYATFASALERVARQLRWQTRALREDKPVNAMN